LNLTVSLLPPLSYPLERAYKYACMLEIIDQHLQQDIEAGRRRGRNVYSFKYALEGLKNLHLAFSELHEDEEYNEANWYILTEKTFESFEWFERFGLRKEFTDPVEPNCRYLFSRVYPRLGVEYSQETGTISHETAGQILVARTYKNDHVPYEIAIKTVSCSYCNNIK
jgi:hypothetical protein